MKKGLVVIGGISIVALSAYLYFKLKKPSVALQTATGNQTVTPNTTQPAGSVQSEVAAIISSGNSAATVEQVIAAVTVNNEAQALANNIKTHRDEFLALKSRPLGILGAAVAKLQRMAALEAAIVAFTQKLTQMGYKEENGVAIKLT